LCKTKHLFNPGFATIKFSCLTIDEALSLIFKIFNILQESYRSTINLLEKKQEGELPNSILSGLLLDKDDEIAF